MIGLVVFIGAVIVMTALAMAGFERLFNHVDVPEPRDPTAPDPTAPGNGRGDG